MYKVAIKMKIDAWLDGYLVGYLYASFSNDNSERKVCRLVTLFVYEDQRGKGIGTALMWRLYSECRTRGVSQITFTDASDRCLRPDNLYTKIGAVYYREGDGEMQWDVCVGTRIPVEEKNHFVVLEL
jgi:GNAT superfamily N-acetyltransferase